jgi:hypothetical protein
MSASQVARIISVIHENLALANILITKILITEIYDCIG